MITCYFESGGKDSLRHVVVGAIIIQNGKILLTKRGTFNGKPLLEFGKWALPGGFLDRDETLLEAAKRETKEETGFDIDNLKLFHIVDNPYRPGEDRQNVNMVFLADYAGGEYIVSEETSEIKWFDVDELPPNDEMAFDFADELDIYRKYLEQKFPLPVIGQTV